MRNNYRPCRRKFIPGRDGQKTLSGIETEWRRGAACYRDRRDGQKTLTELFRSVR